MCTTEQCPTLSHNSKHTMATAYVPSELRAITSPFPLNNYTSLGSKKKSQKRGAKTSEDVELLRKQRLELEKAFRRSKRDAILESRRHVLQTLNWVVWSDDEDDDDGDGSVEFEDASPCEELMTEINKLNSLYDGNYDLFHRAVAENSPLVEAAIAALGSPESDLVSSAIALIVHMTTLEKGFIYTFVNVGGLAHLPKLIEHEVSHIQSHALQVLLNITACDAAFTNNLLATTILEPLVNCLYFGDRSSQTRATEVVSNIAIHGQKEHLIKLIKYGVIDSMTDMLSRKDSESLYLVLSFFRSFFESAERFQITGHVCQQCKMHIPRIEELFASLQPTISKEAGYLLERFDRFIPSEFDMD